MSFDNLDFYLQFLPRKGTQLPTHNLYYVRCYALTAFTAELHTYLYLSHFDVFLCIWSHRIAIHRHFEYSCTSQKSKGSMRMIFKVFSLFFFFLQLCYKKCNSAFLQLLQPKSEALKNA